MENASKALIMAGGVLIGVLIISLAVYLFVSFGQTSAEINSQNAQKQISQFNSQFTSYEGNNQLQYMMLLRWLTLLWKIINIMIIIQII